MDEVPVLELVKLPSVLDVPQTIRESTLEIEPLLQPRKVAPVKLILLCQNILLFSEYAYHAVSAIAFSSEISVVLKQDRPDSTACNLS